MEIVTKYNIGQQVWFSWDGLAHRVPIIGIHIHRYYGECSIRYDLDYYSSECPLVAIPEEQLFLTITELLKSKEL